MPHGRKYAFGSTALGASLGLGMWLVEVTEVNLPLWVIVALSILAATLFVYGIALLLHAGYEWVTKKGKAQRNVTEQRHAAQRLTERPLTDDEKEMLLVFNSTIRANHGHGDMDKLEEDCLKERELITGLCSCGHPRNLPSSWLRNE